MASEPTCIHGYVPCQLENPLCICRVARKNAAAAPTLRAVEGPTDEPAEFERLMTDLCLSFTGQGRNGLPGVRRLVVEAHVGELRRELATLHTTVSTLTEERNADRRELARLKEFQRAINELARMKGRPEGYFATDVCRLNARYNLGYSFEPVMSEARATATPPSPRSES